MNNISFNQSLSDKLNEELNPELRSTPGKDEITVIADEKDGLHEYYIKTANVKVTELDDAYHAEHDENYKKLEEFLKNYR